MTPEVEAWNKAVDTRRQQDLAARKSTTAKSVKTPRTPSRHPFKALLALRAEVELIRQKFVFGSIEYQTTIAMLPPYKGRGHGGSHRTRNRLVDGRWNQFRSKYTPHQGRSEIARRVFQMASPWVKMETRRLEELI